MAYDMDTHRLNLLVQINQPIGSSKTIKKIVVVEEPILTIFLNDGEAIIIVKNPVYDILRFANVDNKIKNTIHGSLKQLQYGMGVVRPIKYIVVALIMIFILGITNINTTSIQQQCGMIKRTDSFSTIAEWRRSDPGFERIANMPKEIGQVQLLGSMDIHGRTIAPHFENIAVADVSLPKSKAFVQDVFTKIRWPRQPLVGISISGPPQIRILAKWTNTRSGIKIDNFYKIRDSEGGRSPSDYMMRIKKPITDVLDEQISEIIELGMITNSTTGWASILLADFLGGISPFELLTQGSNPEDRWHRDAIGSELVSSTISETGLESDPITNPASTFNSVQTFTYFNTPIRAGVGIPRPTTGFVSQKDMIQYDPPDQTSTLILDQRYALHSAIASNLLAVNRNVLIINVFHHNIDTAMIQQIK
jgi:hypothetical protein